MCQPCMVKIIVADHDDVISIVSGSGSLLPLNANTTLFSTAVSEAPTQQQSVIVSRLQ